MAETTMEAVPIPTTEPEKERKKRKFSFPSAFTILFIVTIIAVICTWFVPAGQYSKLLYDSESGKLEMTTPTGEVSELDATQQTLDELGVKIDIDQFTSGAITKAVSIPGTYEGLDPHPVSLADIPYSMVWGVIDGIDVMVFILCLGGLIGVVKVTGAFESGLSALTKKTKGREFLLVFGVSVFMIFGGTMCGLEEEAVAFYPILAPIFIALGYDSIVVVGAIFMAGSIGTTFSTVNPFSAVIASNAAGTVFTEGMISDTMLNAASNLVAGMSGPLFVVCLLLIFFVLGFVVPSSSGLAVLAMPIFAPLADTVGIPRWIIVAAYQFGQYAMLYIAPTGLVMATLQMLDMKMSHWFRFVWPMMVFTLVFGAILLSICSVVFAV